MSPCPHVFIPRGHSLLTFSFPPSSRVSLSVCVSPPAVPFTMGLLCVLLGTHSLRIVSESQQLPSPSRVPFCLPLPVPGSVPFMGV